MLGRRSHARVSFGTGADGVLSLPRDVAVRVTDAGELVAVSRVAGVLGEIVRIAVPDDGLTLKAEVVESTPIITDGAVRHRLWLRRLRVEGDPAETHTGRRS